MEHIQGSKVPECIFKKIDTKHCLTYLALTQLFPVFLTNWFHIVKYTHNVAFAAFNLGVTVFSFLAMNAFTWDEWILLAAFLLDFFFSKLSWNH